MDKSICQFLNPCNPFIHVIPIKCFFFFFFFCFFFFFFFFFFLPPVPR